MALPPRKKTPINGRNNNTNSNDGVNDCREHPIIREIFETLTDHENRLVNMEELAQTLNNIEETIDKVFRYIKLAAPSIIAAAVAAGLVNGKLGAFLNALVTGVPH